MYLQAWGGWTLARLGFILWSEAEGAVGTVSVLVPVSHGTGVC